MSGKWAGDTAQTITPRDPQINYLGYITAYFCNILLYRASTPKYANMATNYTISEFYRRENLDSVHSLKIYWSVRKLLRVKVWNIDIYQDTQVFLTIYNISKK